MKVIVMMTKLRFGARAAALVCLALGAGSLTGCGLGDDSGKPEIVAAFYPLEFVAKQIGGSHVKVTNLTKPGAEPHDLELKPRQVADITDADLVLYLKGFQPAVDDAIKEHNPKKSFDAASVQELKSGYVPTDEHGDETDEHHDEPDNAPADEHSEVDKDAHDKDPHVWLDPTRLARIADTVADQLSDVDPDHKEEFRKAAKKLKGQLTDLDGEYRTQLTNCQQKTFVVSHNAFGYLADRYNLTQIAISGLDPEAEPDPGRLAEVSDMAKRDNVSVIFFETLVSPKVAQTIADQVGAQTKVLDPIEGIEKGNDSTYLTVMRANLKQLRDALGCQ